jgi:hypothetical protein
MFNQQLNTSAELTDLDEEFFDAHAEVLGRFYVLFESIFTFMGDYNKFLRELEEGYFIQYTLEAVLLDVDGRQLLCEGLYLYGVMLLMLDSRLPGCVRERLIVAHYRHKGEGAAVGIADLAKLCRDTGYRHGAAKRPANYPEEYLARFPVSPKVRARVCVVVQCVCVRVCVRECACASVGGEGCAWLRSLMTRRSLGSERPLLTWGASNEAMRLCLSDTSCCCPAAPRPSLPPAPPPPSPPPHRRRSLP